MTGSEAVREQAVDDYLVFQRGIKGLCGVDLAYYKRRQMERRTRAFAVRQGVGDDLTAYLALLRSDPGALELFLDRMTINVSQLWRNPEHFGVLANDVFPELAELRSPDESLQIWSAGCSYGAETYTLAALCLEHPELVGTRPRVEGSDIDPRMIELARHGWFSIDDARSAPPAMLERYFESRDGGWAALPSLRSLVSFSVENLLEARRRKCHLIVCRNVAIYFTETARNQLHAAFADSLLPGGYLLIGATEIVANPKALRLERAFPFIYRKSPGVEGA